MQYGMFSNIPGLYPLDDSSITPTPAAFMKPKMYPDFAKYSLDGRIIPRWEPLL